MAKKKQKGHEAEAFGYRIVTEAVGNGWSVTVSHKLVAIEKGQGLKAGEGHNVLALLEVVSVRVEQLDAITADDCAREGFPGVAPAEFVRFFLQAGRGRGAAEQLAKGGVA